MANGERLRRTAPRIRGMKGTEKIVCLTAYDALSGALAEAVGVDVVLVGDSLGNVIQGHDTTLPVTLDEVIYHLKMVRRQVSRALLVADLPFGTYGGSVQQAFDSATLLMKAGAEAVKLEGPYFDEIRALTKAGIPVMGHLGFTPQSVHVFGGHKVQGREHGEVLIQAAQDLEAAGAFSMVLELIPTSLAKSISGAVSVPTIGIGAGPHCDGEVQVFHDLLGLAVKEYKHTKWYVLGRSIFEDALTRYVADVRTGKFPTEDDAS